MSLFRRFTAEGRRERLAEELAGLRGRMVALNALRATAKELPGWLIEEYLNTAQRIAELEAQQ